MNNSDPYEILKSKLDSVFARYAKVGFNGLSSGEKVFICVWSLKGEVDNGGFDQFFYNSSGDYADYTPTALRKIGAERVADIVDKAIALFPNGKPPQENHLRIQQLDELSDISRTQLSELDQNFL